MKSQPTSTCSAESEDSLLPLDGLDLKPLDSAKSNPIAKPSLKSIGRKSQFTRTSENCGGGGAGRIDLLTGGFPCQPFSFAGKRRGKDDDRYLWQEMFRIIKEANPAWIIGENVAGIINLGLQETITNLEAFGYEVRVFNISALSIDAVHKRERIWIIANSNGKRQNLWEKTDNKTKKQCTKNKLAGCSFGEILKEWKGWKSTPYICRSDDGIPNRAHRLKGLGNAIVPQVAYQIIKGIAKLVKEKR